MRRGFGVAIRRSPKTGFQVSFFSRSLRACESRVPGPGRRGGWIFRPKHEQAGRALFFSSHLLGLDARISVSHSRPRQATEPGRQAGKQAALDRSLSLTLLNEPTSLEPASSLSLSFFSQQEQHSSSSISQGSRQAS